MRMADGPVANLPPGMDAYGGYVNDSGIGETWPGVQLLAAQQHAIAFSFTTNGSPAMCADVEKGAMSEWTGYDYGYCSVANVNDNIRLYGRPRKLLTAHYDPKYGAHICSPQCWPGLITIADGTQWIDHGGWDESLLSPTFFDAVPQPLPPLTPEEIMQAFQNSKGQTVIIGNQQSTGHTVVVTSGADASVQGGWSLADVTADIQKVYPNTVVVIE